jgi:type IV pilus secretin PilQ/predicted competence protein
MTHMIADWRLRIADWRIADWRLRIAVAVLACAGSIALTAGSIESTPVRLLGVSAQGSAVLIEASEPVAYVVSRPDPLTIIVELRETTVAAATNQVSRRDLIAGVTLEDAVAVDGKPVGRVRIALAKPAESKVRSARNTIRLELTAAAGGSQAGQRGSQADQNDAPRTVAPPVHTLLPAAEAPNVEAPVEPRVATELGGVRAHVAGSATIVTLTGNGRLVPTNVTETQERPRRLVFDFAGVSSQAPAQTAVESPLVTRVRVGVNSRSPLVTRVVLEIADGATYHLERAGGDGRSLSIVFEAALAAGAVKVATPDAKADVKPDVISYQEAIANGAALTPTDPVGIDPMAALKAIGQLPPAKQTGGPSASIGPQPPQPPAPVQEPRPQPIAAPAAAQAIGQDTQKKYIGTPITLDLSGVDLRAVLRIFAEPSGLNILIDPGVPNTPQDLLLKEIPWDHAMELVLRANQLGMEVDGTVIRIAPLKVLEDEQKARQSLTAARALAGELRFQTFSLSYAKAEALAPLLIKAIPLSSRGQLQVDTRTNTLIITDLGDRIQTASDLIRTLDRPEPQVEVEARIVQTTRDFARAIGIQWGLNGRMTPEIGNTTNLTFPNRGSVGGRLGQQGAAGTDVRATPGDQTGTVVDLGVSAPNSAIGLALGAINGAFNLDVALSALERSGKGRVLSTPRLTTQNNVLAEIAQGIEIPIQTVSNNTVTVSFKDATLKLLVTPQITAAGTVIMQVEIHNATPDFSREVNGIPPIDTQRALTRVQVDDGATTVIGGIFVSREQSSNDRTPLLHRIPWFGGLFKRSSTQDESRELLIFLTPRIIKG